MMDRQTKTHRQTQWWWETQTDRQTTNGSKTHLWPGSHTPDKLRAILKLTRSNILGLLVSRTHERGDSFVLTILAGNLAHLDSLAAGRWALITVGNHLTFHVPRATDIIKTLLWSVITQIYQWNKKTNKQSYCSQLQNNIINVIKWINNKATI